LAIGSVGLSLLEGKERERERERVKGRKDEASI
jgi:hypothetical protein